MVFGSLRPYPVLPACSSVSHLRAGEDQRSTCQSGPSMCVPDNEQATSDRARGNSKLLFLFVIVTLSLLSHYINIHRTTATEVDQRDPMLGTLGRVCISWQSRFPKRQMTEATIIIIFMTLVRPDRKLVVTSVFMFALCSHAGQ